MWMIVVRHLAMYGLSIIGMGQNNTFTGACIDSFCICAVNCFVLISGWFGINFRLTKVWKLFLQCSFYGLIFYLLHLVIDGAHIGKSLITNSLFVFSNTKLWFIQTYFYLLLCSPIINYVIDNISRSQFKFCLILLTILNLYFGCLWKNDINVNGYNLCQFIYIYFIGRYLFIFKPQIIITKRIKLIALLLISTGLIFLFNLIQLRVDTYHSIFDVTCYCHPLVIVQAIALFLIFETVNINSRIINYIAASSLSIYLIHGNYYAGDIIYRLFENHVSELQVGVQLFALFATSLLIVVGCTCIDKIRAYICRPIDKFITPRLKHADKKLSLYLNSI